VGAAQWLRVMREETGKTGDGAPGVNLAQVRRAGGPQLQARHEAAYAITSFVYEARRAFAREKFVALLEGGLPAGLWRAKGFFWLAEQPADIGFLSIAGGGVRREWVGTWAAALRESGIVTDAEIPAAARVKWAEPYGDRRQELVFIGTGLDVVAWRAKLDACWA
jgi:G3E family GTPase